MYSAKYNKVNNRNSLVVNYPEIARTWDFKKNGSKKSLNLRASLGSSFLSFSLVVILNQHKI